MSFVMYFSVTGDKRALMMDYLPHLRTKLSQPLIKQGSDGVPDVIKVMDDYDLTREDFDNIMEVTGWPGSVDPMTKVETKVSAIMYG